MPTNQKQNPVLRNSRLMLTQLLWHKHSLVFPKHTCEMSAGISPEYTHGRSCEQKHPAPVAQQRGRAGGSVAFRIVSSCSRHCYAVDSAEQRKMNKSQCWTSLAKQVYGTPLYTQQVITAFTSIGCVETVTLKVWLLNSDRENGFQSMHRHSILVQILSLTRADSKTWKPLVYGLSIQNEDSIKIHK